MPLDDLDAVARRHGFSRTTVDSLIDALRRSGGTLAQFNHPELGGHGQWMPGMLQIGDMFNNGLKSRVDALISDLAGIARAEPAGGNDATAPHPAEPRTWWPASLGSPNSAGGQNDVRYAFFANSRRLAIHQHGRVTLYDTAHHQIDGVSQQQSGDTRHLKFTSHHGEVDVEALQVVG